MGTWQTPNATNTEHGPYEPKELPNDPLGSYAPHNWLARQLHVARPNRPGYETESFESAQQERQDANNFSPLVKLRLADIANTQREQQTARGRANADVMQQTASGSPFQRAMTRSKALSRIALQRQNEVVQGSVLESAAMGRFGQGIRAGTNRGLGALSDISSEQTAARMRASQQDSAARMNTLGTVAGGVMRYYQGTNSGYSNNAALRPQYVNGAEGQV